MAKAQKLYGGDFKRQPTESLAGQAFGYRFACTFYADALGAAALPTQLRFWLIRKRDAAVMREFMVSKSGDMPKSVVTGECAVGSVPPQFEYLSVLYAHEVVLNPNEFNDRDGYYLINDAPPVPRAATENIKSANLVLYHWFSPEYLFEKLDNADQGRASTGLSGVYAFMCRDIGKNLRMQLSSSPLVKVFDPQALDLTARTSTPLTDGELPFKNADWQAGFTPDQPNGGQFYITDSKPKFDNNSEITYFSAWTVPVQNGLFSLAFVTEQRQNGVKLAENSLEMYAQVNDCKKVSYVGLSITEAATGSPGGASFCRDKPIQLNAVSNESGFVYQWYRDQKPVAGATGPSLVVQETGSYFLKAKQEGACSESTTTTVNAVAINCNTTGSAAILGSNLHDLMNTTGPTPTGYINSHSFRAIYYTPLADLAKMPKLLKGTIYRKSDNARMDEITFKRNTFADQTHLLERLCDKGIDSIQQVTYDASIEFAANRYNDQQGYYLSTEPICCRADADNMAQNGSSVVTYLEIGPANQVKAHPSIQRGHTVDLNIPFTIKGCVNQPVRVFLYAGNRENITAQFGGFAEVMEGTENSQSFRAMSWGQNYSADNFTGNSNTRFWVEPRRNGQMVMIGVPEKPGTFVYRIRIDGTISGQVYSSVFQEFRLEVNDCTPPPEPRILVSKVGQPNVAASPELCQDSLVQLNLKNFRSWAKLQWLIDKTDILNATDSVLIVPKNRTGLYTCNIKMPRQCPEIISADQKITFLPRPTVAILAPKNLICEGQNLTLAAQSNSNVRTFQWFFDNKDQKNATQVNFEATQAGAYTVTVTDTKGCSNTSDPYKTTVSPLPNTEIKAPQSYFCEGTQLTLSVAAATGQSYQWQREGQPIGTSKAETIVSESANYSVKITNQLGCVATSGNFLVRQIPKLTAAILTPASQFCQGQNLTLTAQTTAEKPQYEWLLENSLLPNATQATFSAPSAGNYAVRITDTYGCVGASPPKNLKVNPLPEATIWAPRNVVCAGKTMNLTANFAAEYSYEWQQNEKTVLVGQANLLLVGQTGSYTVKVTTPFGCSLTSKPVIVQQVKNPVVKITAPASRICQGTQFELLAVGDNLTLFEWHQDGQVFKLGGQNTFAITQTGSYTVTATDPNDCVATSSPFRVEVVQPVVVKIDSLPNFCGVAFAPIQIQASPAGGTFSGKGTTDNYFAPRVAGVGQHTITYTVRGDLACLNGSAQRTIYIRAAPYLDLGAEREIFRGTAAKLNGEMGKGYTYQWAPPTAIDDATAAKPRVAPDSTITYAVLATSPDNCVSEDSIKIVVVQRVFTPDIFTPNDDGLNDTWRIIGIEAYPDIVVTIYNRWGNVIYHAKGNNQKLFDGTFQGQALPEGAYVYVIQAKPDGHIDRGSVIIIR